MDTNKEFQNLVLNEVIELRKELRHHKEDSDKKIERMREEGNNRIDRLEMHVNNRLTLIEQRQINFEQRQAQHENSTAEGFNAATNANTATNNRVDNVEKTLHLHSEQIFALQQTVGKEAEKMAQDVIDGKLKIVPDQRYKGEDKFIGVLIDGKFDNENIPKDKEGKKFPRYKEKIKELSTMCVSVAMRHVIDGALAAHKIERTMNTLCPSDQRTLGETFAAAFNNTNIGITGLNPYVAIAEVGLRAVATASVLGWKYYKLYKEKKELKRHWNQKTAKYKKEIISMLIDSTEEGFNKMYEELRHCYHYNYNMDSVEVKDISIWMAVFTISDIHYQRQFTKIPDQERNCHFIQDCGSKSGISYKVRVAEQKGCMEIFKIEKFLKPDLTEEQKKKIDWMFRIIRANDEKVEFASHICSGDGEFCESPVSLVLQNIFTAGMISLPRLGGQYDWTSSNNRLEHILLGYVSGCSSDKFKEIIERNEALARLKAYVDSSDSEFAKYCYEECLKDRYIGVEPEYIEQFEEGFKLYCKIYNLCECNPENYLDYVYTISTPEAAESTNLVTEGLDRLINGVKETGSALTTTQELWTEDTDPVTKIKTRISNKTPRSNLASQITTVGSHFTDDIKVLTARA